MTVNSISPGFVKLFYTHSAGESVATYPVIPIDPEPGDASADLRINADLNNPFTDSVEDFVALLAVLALTTTSFNRAELWSKPLPTDDPIFITSHDLGVSGASGATPPNGIQVTLTHRTSVGGVSRLVLFGTALGLDVRDTPPFVSPGLTAISNYMRSSQGWIYGRDGGKCIAPIAATSKINDAKRKDRLNL